MPRPKKPRVELTRRMCPRCQTIKPVEDFYRVNRPSGYSHWSAWCRACTCAYVRPRATAWRIRTDYNARRRAERAASKK